MLIVKENYNEVQKGFSILLNSLSTYVCKEIRFVYKGNWWNTVLTKLYTDRNLPLTGTYDELVSSLDIANSLRLVNVLWFDVFKQKLDNSCRSWVNELIGTRNIVSHIGNKDLPLDKTERALNTMWLLCHEIDHANASHIKAIYDAIRAKSIGTPVPPVVVSKNGGLLSLVGTDAVQKTTNTRKVTFGGKTEDYAVYKVKLDSLYYNDQNDRIATWISKYESENGAGSLVGLHKDIFNGVIEGFICDSNPETMEKTQKNIEIIGQRIPGVTLADGRVVDGNRRFTCLRKIQDETNVPQYFETVIIDADINNDKKQIKLLELSVQHGEEEKVEYDKIDYAIGTYRDIKLNKLLTVDDYATSANEKTYEVNRRIAVAELIVDFLKYLNLDGQYYVAREYQVYDLFQGMLPILKKLKADNEKQQLKKIVYTNALMKAVPDQRMFIRKINEFVTKVSYNQYFSEQMLILKDLEDLYNKENIRNKDDVDAFAKNNNSFITKLKNSFEKALQIYKLQTVKNEPAEYVDKSRDLILQIDVRLFSTLSTEAKAELRKELDDLKNIIENMSKHI